MYCYQCGSGLDNDERFCRACGTKAPMQALTRAARGWLAYTGYFAAGVITFPILFFLLMSLAAFLFPGGGPQLAILVLLIIGSLISGWFIANTLSNRGKQTDEPGVVGPRQFRSEERRALKDGVGFEPVDSVTTQTTRDLSIK